MENFKPKPIINVPQKTELRDVLEDIGVNFARIARMPENRELVIEECKRLKALRERGEFSLDEYRLVGVAEFNVAARIMSKQEKTTINRLLPNLKLNYISIFYNVIPSFESRFS